VPVWLQNSTQQFTVRSAYVFLNESPSIQEATFKIWEITAPLRVHVFLWLLLQDKILTIENMRKRGWIVASMCYLCRQHQESMIHIFEECDYGRESRNYMAVTMPPSKQQCAIYQNSMHPLQLLTGSQSMFWRQVEATTIFILWRERCRRIFADKNQGVIETTREVRKELKQWFKE
jgi:zinc-binding in reverse transcriptase